MKPRKAWITICHEIDMNGWDDDVDWSDPAKVIMEQYDSCGLDGLGTLGEPEVQCLELLPAGENAEQLKRSIWPHNAQKSPFTKSR